MIPRAKSRRKACCSSDPSTRGRLESLDFLERSGFGFCRVYNTLLDENDLVDYTGVEYSNDAEPDLWTLKKRIKKERRKKERRKEKKE